MAVLEIGVNFIKNFDFDTICNITHNITQEAQEL